jgi:hypothetical protein
MMIVRKYALKSAVVSDPVSDRYVITCYGGPIDLVHFFMLASNVCSGQHELETRLYREWVAEGGPDNLDGFNHREPPEAHPDDLPSNALGALFGLELRAHNQRKGADLRAAFRRFIAPLLPVPDAVARRFSHREIVMGLPEKASVEQRQAQRTWFTAAPLVQSAKLNRAAKATLGKSVCVEFVDGAEALKKAGFVVQAYKGRRIVIRRKTQP